MVCGRKWRRFFSVHFGKRQANDWSDRNTEHGNFANEYELFWKTSMCLLRMELDLVYSVFIPLCRLRSSVIMCHCIM